MYRKESLISVIVPVYNVEMYISECIESILNQSHSFIQLILVDDGSTDKSLEICKTYAKKDERILLLHQKNKGVSYARNVGIDNAIGDFIGFVDSDDTIDSTMYEEMLNKLLEYNSDMCVSTQVYYNDEILKTANINKNTVTKLEAMRELLHFNFPTSLWSCLYKKEVIKDNHLNINIHYWEDYEYQLRVIDKVTGVSICDTPLYHYRQRENSANHQDINDKVITCLKIADIVNEKIRNDYKEYESEAKMLYSHFLQMTIGYLGESKNVEKKYFHIIRKNARRYFLQALFMKDITIFMKIYMFICLFDAKLYWRLYRYIKYKKV